MEVEKKEAKEKGRKPVLYNDAVWLPVVFLLFLRAGISVFVL